MYSCYSCGKITEREWRAPALDGRKIEPYVTKYEEGKEGSIKIKGFLKISDLTNDR